MSEVEPSGAAGIMGERKSPDERKAALARTVSNQLAQGWRVESQSDYQAVLAKGRRISHGLHLFLTIITVGLWGVIWIAMWIINREQRRIANVDNYGNVSVAKV